MAWEYLPQLDERLKVVADYLKGKTKGKVIVDLDCLEARLLKYIDHDFKEYLGNDVLDMFPKVDGATFFRDTDDKFVRELKACDILCMFGHGGYEMDHAEPESKTLTDSIKYAIDKFKPEIVVLESIVRYEPITSKIISKGYKLVKREELDLGEEYTKKRVVLIYEKQGPPLAIVIGTRTKYDFLDKTLENLFATTPNSEFILIGVNNVPDVETGKKTKAVFDKYLRKEDKYIENVPEVGVYHFWNQGLKEALKRSDTRWVGIFNDDILLPSGWWGMFKQILESNPQIPFLFPEYTSGATIPTDWQYRNDMAISQMPEVYQDVLCGFMFVCPKATFESIGLFDEQFTIWAGDTDYYYRLLEAETSSYRTVNVIIHHYYSRTLNEMRVSDPLVDKTLEEDRNKLINKYGFNPDCFGKLPPLRP